MAKYLYGLSIKGIQDFIFQTNKLKEIVGASEWIERVCKEKFQEAVGSSHFNEKQLLQAAAGSIKYIFEDKESCEKIARTFVKSLRNDIPDLNINQAVVEMKGDFRGELRTLNQRLSTQRNKSVAQHGLGLMISKRSKRTGRAGRIFKTENKENVLQDNIQLVLKKYDKGELLGAKLSGGHDLEFPTEFAQIADRDSKNWIAVIHADGNDMGKKVSDLLKNDRTDSETVKAAYGEFSNAMEVVTREAVQRAFEDVFLDDFLGKTAPIRPIIIGGDDVTFVMRADYALEFTQIYLREFSKGTQELFGKLSTKYPTFFKKNDKITACAGIAYVKSHYPFHYATDLAEDLTKYAKEKAEGLKGDNPHKQSCLGFHKVQSSFVEDYDDIVNKELITKSGIRFDNGPYFIGNAPEGHTSVADLKKWVDIISEPKAPLGGLRNWIMELYKSKETASNLWNRMERLPNFHAYKSKLGLVKWNVNDKRTHLLDVVTLASIRKPKK